MKKIYDKIKSIKKSSRETEASHGKSGAHINSKDKRKKTEKTDDFLDDLDEYELERFGVILCDCGANCDYRNRKDKCWGRVEGFEEWGEEFNLWHACEGHKDIHYGGKYIKQFGEKSE